MRLKFVMGPDTLDEVQIALDTFWFTHQQVPNSVQIEVGIAVAEIAANIVEHGDCETMRLIIGVGPTQMRVSFTDNGSPVTVDLSTVSMPDESAEHGRGLALAKAALGLLSYHCDQLGNHWDLISKAFTTR